MAKTYQANNFTGKQLDEFMGKVLNKSLAGQGLCMDEDGKLHVLSPNYGTLLYTYTHTANHEVYPEGINLTTGEFAATAHGLSNNNQVYVVVHAPHHLNNPYNYLPGGLKIGANNGIGQFAKQYYVTVVDEDTFTLSESEGGAAIIFTEVSTMDLTKFHFEKYTLADIKLSNLPQSKEALVVVKGRMINGYRYLTINNRGKAGAVGYDSDTQVYVGAQNAALYLGSQGGWGSMYLTAEIKFIGEKHVLITTNQDTMSYKPDNSTVTKHVRKYVHYYMTQDYFDQIVLSTDGMLANGTTVEVYTK